jgi:hypothetical protein
LALLKNDPPGAPQPWLPTRGCLDADGRLCASLVPPCFGNSWRAR